MNVSRVHIRVTPSGAQTSQLFILLPRLFMNVSRVHIHVTPSGSQTSLLFILLPAS